MLRKCKMQIEKLNDIMDKVIREDDGWYPSESKKLDEALYRVEKLALNMRSLYEADYSPQHKETEKKHKNIAKKIFKVEVNQIDLDEIHIKIPMICTKKRTNDQYFRDSLNIQLGEYFKDPLLLKDRVVVFTYTYPPKGMGFKGVRRIDYDNVELRSVLNVLSLYVIHDDGPQYYRLFCCYQEEEKDGRDTTISILSNEKFLKLLQKKQVIKND